MLHLVFARPLQFLVRSFVLTIFFVGGAFAAPIVAADMVAFSIERQPLGTALNEFARQSDREILFATDVVEGIKGQGVAGMFEPEEALTILLTDTGLRYSVTDNNTFLVRFNATTQASLSSAQGLAADTFGSLMATQASTAVAGAGQGDATPAVLSGRVVDEVTGSALSGAILELKGTNMTAATNTRGEYRFAAVPPGDYEVVVSYLGTGGALATVVLDPDEVAVQDFQVAGEMDTITVYGSNRSSLAQALNLQRAAPNSATVVAADLLGSFPAETVSEALRRVSGVSFERNDDTGEGSNITIRGFNSEAINIQMNGLELQGTGIARTVDLSGFLADNISQITIQKSLLPSHEATGTGGLVEIETRSGLEYGDKYFSFGLEREQSFESDFGDELQANATAAWKFSETFGAVATVQYRETDRANFDTGNSRTVAPVLPAGFTSFFFLPERFNYPFDPEFSEPLLTGGNYFRRTRDETNLTTSLSLAWDAVEHTTLRLDVQRIERDTSLSEARSTIGYLTSATDMPVPELGGEVRRRTYIRGLRPTVGLVDEDSDLSTTTISFRGNTDIGPWEFEYKLGQSESILKRKRVNIATISDIETDVVSYIDPASIVINLDDNAAMTPRVVGGAVFASGDGIPTLALAPAGRALIDDPNTYNITSAALADSRNPTESKIAEFRSRYNFASDHFNYVELGGKYQDTERANSDDVLSVDNLTSAFSYVRPFGGPNTVIADLGVAALGSQSLSLLGAGNYSVPMFEAGTAGAFFDAIADLPDVATRFNLTDRTVSPIDSSGAISPATIFEESSAAYLQSMVSFNKLELVGGVRYERVDRSSVTISSPTIILDLPGFQTEPRNTLIDAGLVDFKNIGGVIDNWTPSLLATFRQTDNLIFRLGYFRSTVNPNLRLISRPPQFIVDLRSGRERATIREANPDLSPTVTDNYDLDIAYYFDENPGLLRLGVFFKKISNNFTSVLLADEAAEGTLRDRVLAELAPLQATRPDLLALPDTTEFFLNRPTNGDGGEVYGAEFEVIRQLDFLPQSWPEFLGNFTVLGNITYTDGDVPTLVQARDDAGVATTLSLDRPLLRQSEWSGTASLSYEEGGFSGRLIFTEQAGSITAYDEFNLNSLIPRFSTLDLRLSYTLGGRDGAPRYVLFLEGDDLLTSSKDADIRTAISSKSGDGDASFFFPTLLQFNGGRTLTLGARVSFD